MTQIAGTTDTFDLASLKESLDPVIWDVFPGDTYFQNTIAKTKVSNSQHQWVFDTLAAPANNKQIQGDTYSAGTLVTAYRVSNYTQISSKVISVSGTAQATDNVGGNPLGRGIMKSMKALKHDIEYDLLGRQGSSAGATNTAAASGGACAWIWGTGAAIPGNTVYPSVAGTNGNTTGTTPSYASSAVAGQTDGTTAASTVVLADITSAAELAWTDGGEPDVIIASSAQKKYIDQMTSLATRTADIGKSEMLSIQGSANLIVTSFGTFKVVMSRYLNRTTTLLMQMDMWALGQLRSPKVETLAKTGDADLRAMVAEYTLVARNPFSSAKIQGFAP